MAWSLRTLHPGPAITGDLGDRGDPERVLEDESRRIATPATSARSDERRGFNVQPLAHRRTDATEDQPQPSELPRHCGYDPRWRPVRPRNVRAGAAGHEKHAGYTNVQSRKKYLFRVAETD